jgi:Tol biopolymer transport system component
MNLKRIAHGIALICGLALLLGSSAHAEASSRIAFATSSFIHGSQLNFVSPTGKVLGQIKDFRSPIALSASDNGRYVAALPEGEFDESEDEMDEGVYYSAFVYKAGTRQPRRVEIGFGSGGIGAAPSLAPLLAISPNGHLLAFSGSSTIRIINLDTGRRSTLRKPRGSDFQASFSSDGRHLVFAHHDTTCQAGKCERKSDIFMTAIGGSSRHRLTDDPEEELFPVISPDGRWLAFLRRTPRAYELVTKRVGSDQERVIRRVHCLFSRPDFSPDGKRIVYAWNKNSECGELDPRTIFIVGIDGRGTHAVARGIKGGQPLPQWTRVPSR